LTNETIEEAILIAYFVEKMYYITIGQSSITAFGEALKKLIIKKP